MANLKQRFLLVSDMHYTVGEAPEVFNKTHPGSVACAASGNAFGLTQREKIEKVYTDIMAENERAPLDAVLVLGDLSVDDYDFRNLPVNYCIKFKEDCLDRLPCPSYTLAGNHDSYPSSMWEEFFGYGREYAIEIDGSVFIMLDTFKAIPATTASGAAHTPVDYEFLKNALDEYKGKKIFLCSHYFETRTTGNSTFTDEVRQLIKDNEDIVFMYRGHTHVNSVTNMGEEYGEKTIIDIGGYGYQGMKIDNRYEFNIFDFKWAWGYQILEIYDDFIKTYHVKTKMHYEGVNGSFDVDETVSGETTKTLKS